MSQPKEKTTLHPIKGAGADRPATIMFILKRFDCNDGVASYCEAIIRGLMARGDRVIILSGPVTELYGSQGRRVAVAEMVVDWLVFDDFSASRPKISMVRRVMKAIKDYGVDVLSPQGLSVLPLAWLFSKLCGRPVVANYHASMGGNSPNDIPTRQSAKSRLGYAALIKVTRPSKIIAISEEVFNFFRRDCGVSPARLALITHGVDMAHYRPPTEAERASSRERLNIPPRALVCELSGRLNFVKGHDIVIDAVRKIRRTHHDLGIVCLFPGHGDQAEQIKSYAFQTEEDKDILRFLGFLNASDLRTVYWASDLALMPSRFESFGLSMVEAMACGCVPIRTPSGGCQEQIINGINGFIVPFNDPGALADCIVSLRDEGYRGELRQNGISFAKANFSQTKMIEETSNLYRRISETL